MKPRLLILLSLLLTAFLLGGCPDSSKLPKVPPSTPEPKASAMGARSLGAVPALVGDLQWQQACTA